MHCPEALCSHVPVSASPRLITAWKTHTGFALVDIFLSFAGDREHGLELSRVSGCRVPFISALQHRILKGSADSTGPARAGVGVCSEVLYAQKWWN